MNPTTYTPRAGSLASNVIGFFTNNPHEELDLDAITSKFDASRGNVHTLLGGALDAGLLERNRNVDGDYIYTAGKALGKPAVAAPPAAPTVTKPRRVFVNVPLPAIDAVQIDDDVPLPAPLGGKGPKQDWTPLLTKLKAGQSAGLPLRARPILSKNITALHKAQTGTYALRVDRAAQTLRVWRTA